MLPCPGGWLGLRLSPAGLPEATSFLYALIELLAEKGIITVAELDACKDVVAPRIKKRFLYKGMGVDLVESDRANMCSSRRVSDRLREPDSSVPGCLLPILVPPLTPGRGTKALCTGISSFPTSLPKMATDTASTGRLTYRCQVYQQRPIPCRAFDCRNDNCIWLDFEQQANQSESGGCIYDCWLSLVLTE